MPQPCRAVNIVLSGRHMWVIVLVFSNFHRFHWKHQVFAGDMASKSRLAAKSEAGKTEQEVVLTVVSPALQP